MENGQRRKEDELNWKKTGHISVFALLASAGAVAGIFDGIPQKGICAVPYARSTEFVQPLVDGGNWYVLFTSDSDEGVDQLVSQLSADDALSLLVSVEKNERAELPYSAGFVDLLILGSEAVQKVSVEEAFRAVNEFGQIHIVSSNDFNAADWGRTVDVTFVSNSVVLHRKRLNPYDEWTHWVKAPDNNAVSTDVTPDEEAMQWLVGPHHAASPSISLVAGGRTFTATGGNAEHRREEGSLHTLTARNAFNGVELWKRSLASGYNVFRSCFVASSNAFYILDESNAVLVLDAQTGEELETLNIPGVAADEELKWMVLKDGVLYLAWGTGDPPAGTALRKRAEPGNPSGMQAIIGWEDRTLGEVFYGFTSHVGAYDLSTRTLDWTVAEEGLIDTRSLGIGGDRLFYYVQNTGVVAVALSDGGELWRNKDPDMLAAIEERNVGEKIQTKVVSLCHDDYYLLQITARKQLLCFDASSGENLWRKSKSESRPRMPKHIMLIDGKLCSPFPEAGLYDLATGDFVKSQHNNFGGGCNRATASANFIFGRGRRSCLDEVKWKYDSFIRSDCWTGVLPVYHRVYWSAMPCDCMHDFTGYLCRSALDYDWEVLARESNQIETGTGGFSSTVESDRDWVAYRANRSHSASTSVEVKTKGAVRVQWSTPLSTNRLSPSITVGAKIYAGSADGYLYCLDSVTGSITWRYYTGSVIRQAPLFANGAVYVGNQGGDVCVLNSETGRLIWRFQAAPKDRKINLYGEISSSWPVVGLVERSGMLYVSCGILDLDGIAVYCLNSTTGGLLWKNTTSGRKEVSAMGHLVVAGEKLMMAGGLHVSPAAYDLSDGRFSYLTGEMNKWGSAPLGSDLTKGEEMGMFADNILLYGGRPLYAEEGNNIYRGRFSFLMLNEKDDAHKIEVAVMRHGHTTPAWDNDLFVADILPPRGDLWHQSRLCGWDAAALREYLYSQPEAADKLTSNEAVAVRKARYLTVESALYESSLMKWEKANMSLISVVLAKNAVLALVEEPDGDSSRWELQALDRETGALFWTVSVPSLPIQNALSLQRDGAVIVNLSDGTMLCVE